MWALPILTGDCSLVIEQKLRRACKIVKQCFKYGMSHATSMIQIKYCDIPLFLKSGEFYRTLCDDDSEGLIEIPAECYWEDGRNVRSAQDFAHLLQVMVFWALDEIPEGVMKYCKQNDIEQWRSIAENLPGGENSEILKDLVVGFTHRGGFKVTDVIQTGRWELIEHVIASIDLHREDTAQTTLVAAGTCCLRALQLLHERSFPWHKDVCTLVAQKGSVECLQFLRSIGCAWDINVYLQAALCGQVNVIDYAHKHGLSWDASVSGAAAQTGQLAVLKYLHENGCPWDNRIYLEAARNGNIEVMKYAFASGLPWGSNSLCCEVAAHFGHIKCLVFAHTHGCPCSEKVINSAASQGRMECLEYAIESGCPMNVSACVAACYTGQINALRLLTVHGALWDETTCEAAVQSPGMECLCFLYENNCPWNEKTTENAARFGHADQLRFAMDRGCPYSAFTLFLAAGAGSLPCLQYLIAEQGLYMGDETLFLISLLRGDFPCLQFLLDHQCAFTEAGFGGPSCWGGYDHYFRKNNPDFVLCVQLAIDRGWSMQSNLIDYMCSRDWEHCKSYLSRNWDLTEPELDR